MESLRHTFRQFRDLFRSMAPSQQGTLVIIPLVIVAALFFIMVRDPASSYVPLSWGKSFSSDELVKATKALREKGLEDYRLDGGRILVPGNQLQRYNSALMEGNALPTDWTVALEKQLDIDGIFGTNATLTARKDMVLQRGLAEMIGHAPDIESAEVYFDRSKRSHWSRSKTPQVTAMVSFMPKGGQKLSLSRINSLRYAVAGAVGGGLQVEDVVIYDNHYGHSYRAKKEGDPSQDHLLNRQREYTSYYEEKIYGVIDRIEGVRVGVEVKLDDTKMWAIKTHDLDPKKLVAIKTIDRTKKQNSNQQRPNAEPGMTSNGGRNLNANLRNQKSESFTDTISEIESRPSVKDEYKERFAAPPKSISVSVSIPEDYYLQVAAEEQGLTKGETEEELADYRKQARQAVEQLGTEKIVNDKINEIVRGTIGGDATTNPITVTKYFSIHSKPKEVTTSITQTATQLIGKWGAAIGLALFALWALRMLSKSTAKLPVEEPEPQPEIKLQRTVEQEEEGPEELVSDSSKRDYLQNVVRDNPEMTAAVLGKWLHTNK